MQYRDATDREAADCSQRGDHHEHVMDMQDVPDYCSDSKKNSRDIEPEWRVNWRAKVSTKSKLQQERGESDGGDDH